jgi:hypothetical protein
MKKMGNVFFMANFSRNSSKDSPTYMQQLLNVNSLVSSIECHYWFHWVREINIDFFTKNIYVLSQVMFVNMMMLFFRGTNRVSEHYLLKL